MKPLLQSILFVLATIVCTYSFLDEERSLTEMFSTEFDQNFSELMLNLQLFEKAVKDKQTTKKIQQRYLDVRMAYKTVEPILLYFDKTAVERNLNGAPLLKVEPNAPGINILQPKGLQVLDELMGEENPDSEELLVIIKNFQLKLNTLRQTIQVNLINHRMAIEIYQLSLVKILTLEQSGFDTPGTLNGLQDSKTTLKSINKILYPYLHQFPKLKTDVEALTGLMQLAEKELEKANDFNTFDRASFLSVYIQPLFKKVNQIHEKSGIEYYDEVSRFPMSLNTRSNDIFSDDFLNITYYTGVEAKNEDLIALGKTLFFDPILSKNNQRACASCHSPKEAFTNNVKGSAVFNFEGELTRNTPTILNAIYASDYFHDLRAQEVRNIIEHVVFNPKEFATGYSAIEGKLRKSNEYQALFKKSFGVYDGEYINKNSINTALTAYVQSLTGWNSEFDKFARGDENTLTNDAKAGFNLFMGKAQCAICHFPPTFAGLVPPYFEDSESEVLGITTQFDTLNPVLDDDLGRFASGKVKDQAMHFKNSFKTPTVRNAALTFPYMHNGAFKTLAEVLHFYNHGGGAGLGLKVDNQTLPNAKLGLSSTEMLQLKAFIVSLTDTVSVDMSPPTQLPVFGVDSLDKRIIGGEY